MGFSSHRRFISYENLYAHFFVRLNLIFRVSVEEIVVRNRDI